MYFIIIQQKILIPRTDIIQYIKNNSIIENKTLNYSKIKYFPNMKINKSIMTLNK